MGFPLHVVDNGRSLRDYVKTLTNYLSSRRYVDIPVYLKGRNSESDGIGRRQCTNHNKIRRIRRRIWDMLGLRPRQRVPAGTLVELWLGISTDEAVRIKDSRDRWITTLYPLIEAGMSRQDCIPDSPPSIVEAALVGLRHMFCVDRDHIRSDRAVGGALTDFFVGIGGGSPPKYGCSQAEESMRRPGNSAESPTNRCSRQGRLPMLDTAQLPALISSAAP